MNKFYVLVLQLMLLRLNLIKNINFILIFLITNYIGDLIESILID